MPSSALTVPVTPKITAGAFGSGPPASPQDGDIWIATGVDGTTGVTWQFRYNAASASSFKWEFIGGAPAIRQDPTRTARSVGTINTWQTVPGISAFTTARAGEYQFMVGAGIAGAPVGIDLFLSLNSFEPLARHNPPTAGLVVSMAAGGATAVAASYAWTMQVFVGNIAAYVADTYFFITPIRVS